MKIEKTARIKFTLTVPDGYPEQQTDELFDEMKEMAMWKLKEIQDRMQKCIKLACDEYNIKLE